MPRPPPSPVDLFPDLREGGGRTRCSRLPRQHRSKHRHRPLHHGTDANTRYSTPCVTLVKTQDNIDVLGGTLVSDQAFQASWNIAAAASATAAVACIGTWQTDFRDDLPKIDVPVLTVQGDADRILPYPNTGKRLPGLINDMQLVVIEGGPHAITWTHADQVNRALLGFLD